MGTQIGRSKWALKISGIITWAVGHSGELAVTLADLGGNEVTFNLKEQAVAADRHQRVNVVIEMIIVTYMHNI